MQDQQTTDEKLADYAHAVVRHCAEQLEPLVSFVDGEARWADTRWARVTTDSIIARLGTTAFRRGVDGPYIPCPRAVAAAVKRVFDVMAGLSFAVAAAPGTVTMLTLNDDDPEADAVVTRVPAREIA